MLVIVNMMEGIVLTCQVEILNGLVKGAEHNLFTYTKE
jgi:hypothetical protein